MRACTSTAVSLVFSTFAVIVSIVRGGPDIGTAEGAIQLPESFGSAGVRPDTPLDAIDSDVGTPLGWRMQDRFYGIRFEVSLRGGDGFGERYIEAMVAEADRLYGFGWVLEVERQNPAGVKTFAGEFRGNKLDGPIFAEWLRRSGNVDGIGIVGGVDGVQIKVYADTKIRYHFTHFRIMNLYSSSITCFPEPPFACDAAAEPSNTGVRTPRSEL